MIGSFILSAKDIRINMQFPHFSLLQGLACLAAEAHDFKTLKTHRREIENHLDCCRIAVYISANKSIILDILVYTMRSLVQLPSEFDYNLLLQALKDYKKPRDKIRGLINNKDIIRVKKGLYVLGEEYNTPYNKFVLANLIYGPSYITGQTALAFWNMIPERVELIISMTAKRKKLFETPVGSFSYLYCPQKVFNIGIRLEDAGDGKKILIASPEKALCDMAAMQTHILTNNEMAEFIELLRLDLTSSANLDLSLIKEINNGYQRKSVKLLCKYLKESYV